MDYRLWLKPEDYPSWLCPQRPAQTPAPTIEHIMYDEPDEEEKEFHRQLRQKYDKGRRQ